MLDCYEILYTPEPKSASPDLTRKLFKQVTQPLLLRLTTKDRIHRILTNAQHLSPSQPKRLRSKQILIRDRATEKAHVISLEQT